MTATPFDLALSVCTFNNARTIERTLQSVRGLARRIVIVDSGSTDNTIDICKAHGAEVLYRTWDGPTIQKQFCLDQCNEHRWVLMLDSDESLEPQLHASIRQALERDDPAFSGWDINRKVWFMDGWLHHVFQPEWRTRLVRGGTAKIVGIGEHGRGGHDRVEVSGSVGRLAGDCRHDSWIDTADMCRRMIALGQRAGDFESRGGSALDILVRPGAAMFKQYILKRGFLDGRRGLIVSAGVAAGTLMKHMFIAQRKLRNRDSTAAPR